MRRVAFVGMQGAGHKIESGSVVHISIFGACLGLGPNPATVSSNFGGFHGQWFNNGNSY